MDHLSNILSSIKAGSARGNFFVKGANTVFIREILNKLIEEGFIGGYRVEGFYIYVFIKYYQGDSVIKGLKRLSKPGKKVYLTKQELRKEGLKGNHIIYSCSKGIMSSFDLLNKKISEGGEALFLVHF